MVFLSSEGPLNDLGFVHESNGSSLWFLFGIRHEANNLLDATWKTRDAGTQAVSNEFV